MVRVSSSMSWWRCRYDDTCAIAFDTEGEREKESFLLSQNSIVAVFPFTFVVVFIIKVGLTYLTPFGL